MRRCKVTGWTRGSQRSLPARFVLWFCDHPWPWTVSCGTCSCSLKVSDSPEQGFGKAEPDQLSSSMLENNLKSTTAPNLKTVGISSLRNFAQVVPGLFTHEPNSFSCKIHFKANCTMKRDQGRSTRRSGLFWALLSTGRGDRGGKRRWKGNRGEEELTMQPRPI